MITLPAAVIAELESGDVRFAWTLDFAGLQYTTHDQDVTIGADTWLATGKILSMPGSVREREIKSHSVQVSLEDQDGFLDDYLSANNQAGSSFEIGLVLFDSAGAVIDDTRIILYQGTFDSWSLKASPTSDVIQIKAVGLWAKANQTASRRISELSQEERHSGDKFFQFAHEKRTDLLWGGEA